MPFLESNISLSGMAARIASLDSFAICGHVSPDGDCLGSMLALARALRASGKTVDCLLAKDDSIERGLRFLPGFDDVAVASDYDGNPQAFIACDVPNRDRLKDAAAVQARCEHTFTIDHHASSEAMSQWNIIEPERASTTMIVWDLLAALGFEPDSETATCAYTGLMTDTGRFQFQNTDADCFRYAAAMVACGARPDICAREVFQNRSFASLRLEERMVSRIVWNEGRTSALSFVTRADFSELGAIKADAEPLIDALRELEGVRVACVLREQEHEVRGSLRAKDETDVSAIAARFGGGGHKAAAGFTLEGSLQDAIDLMTATLRYPLPASGAVRGA